MQSLLSELPGQSLSAEEVEELTSNEFNRLASIFQEVLGNEDAASYQVQFSTCSFAFGADKLWSWGALAASHCQTLCRLRLNFAFVWNDTAAVAGYISLTFLLQNAISEHSGLMQAQVEDPFLSGFAQMEVETILGIAIANQKSSGYTVGEIGAENIAFTKKVRPMVLRFTRPFA